MTKNRCQVRPPKKKTNGRTVYGPCVVKVMLLFIELVINAVDF